MSNFTIGKVADRSGFSTSALRYYETHGLLEPVARTEAGYRLYDEASLMRLEFVSRAKELGCSLEQIADLAGLWEAEECGPVQVRLHELVTANISAAKRRSVELMRFVGQLQAAATRLGAGPASGPCQHGCACMATDVETQPNPVSLELGDRPDANAACALEPMDVHGRLADWQNVLRFVTDRHRTDDGHLRLSFQGDVPVADIALLTAAEQECCSFFAFVLTVDSRGVGLEIEAPPTASSIVEAIFGAVS